MRQNKHRKINDSRAEIILKVMAQFGLKAWVEAIKKGPTFCRYVLGYEPGSFRRTVLKLDVDLALNLKVRNIRMIPPSPEFPYLGIEVPNEKRITVWFDEMLPALYASKANIPIALGKSVEGETIIKDLTRMPHLLLLGDRGSGKTVFIKSLIESIIHTKEPEEVKFVIMDNSMAEYSNYEGSPYFLSSVIAPEKEISSVLHSVFEEMERRMILFKDSGKKHLDEYNRSINEGKLEADILPYIIVIIDEFGGLSSEHMHELRYWIKRITAVARFLGIHLVMSTRYVSEDVVSKEISYNIPSLVQFYVRNGGPIMDTDVTKLERRGDLLFREEGVERCLRLQGVFADA